MEFKLSFDMDSEAFAEDWNYEAGRILLHISAEVRDGVVSGDIRDVNGNKVGRFEAVK
jgi:hypothetical protein